MCGTITARNIAKIIGSIMSMNIALGSIVASTLYVPHDKSEALLE